MTLRLLLNLLVLTLLIGSMRSTNAELSAPDPLDEGFHPMVAKYGVDRPILSGQYAIEVVPVTLSRDASVTLSDRYGLKKYFPLSKNAAQVARVWVVGDLLFVHSWLNGNRMSQIDTFEISSGARRDTFWGWNPEPSPEGDKIALVRSYPSHANGYFETQYRLYDAKLSPFKNRTNEKETSAEKGGSDGSIDGSTDAGFSLYPLIQSDVVFSEEMPINRQVGTFFWGSTSREVSFINVTNRQAYLFLAKISDSGNSTRPDIYRARTPEFDRLCGVASTDICINPHRKSIRAEFVRDAVNFVVDPSNAVVSRSKPSELLSFSIGRARFTKVTEQSSTPGAGPSLHSTQ